MTATTQQTLRDAVARAISYQLGQDFDLLEKWSFTREFTQHDYLRAATAALGTIAARIASVEARAVAAEAEVARLTAALAEKGPTP